MSSAYVKRIFLSGKVGWTGPIRSLRQAEREAAAWRLAGWTTEILPSTPEVRAQVRAWTKEMDAKHNRTRSPR